MTIPYIQQPQKNPFFKQLSDESDDSVFMKISFQNPTRGPLITISFGDDAGVTTAFVPAVADCATKATSRHIIASGGTATVAGPLALVGMLFWKATHLPRAHGAWDGCTSLKRLLPVKPNIRD
jgi:hypothetical protein